MGLILFANVKHTCINSAILPFYFIWNNSQVLCLVNKNVGTYTYIQNRRLPRESIYGPVYICVFKFSPKTTEPMKPKVMWNHNRIGEES